MKKISFRIESIEHHVLEELKKQGKRPSSIIRRALSKYLHDNHQPIYKVIWAENHRRYELRLKAYYDRQTQEKQETSTNNHIPISCPTFYGNKTQKQTHKPRLIALGVTSIVVVTMPLIEMGFVKGTLTPEQKANLARKVTELVAQEAKQSKDHIWVVVHEESPENLMFGGLTIQELMQQKK